MGFGGRRQSSVSGTSRMMREYQVRFCERLGVKFPGPTRHSFTGWPSSSLFARPVMSFVAPFRTFKTALHICPSIFIAAIPRSSLPVGVRSSALS